MALVQGRRAAAIEMSTEIVRSGILHEYSGVS
ncbi:hypothetical protein E2C01_090243 [Portunus trituberculatus]|uniref:Uncharacterized protein n=1 Tax=Portunus trituberculatus TaxID=210409 RepID=A0A5B7JJR0_PORTR|nr:hypothetical protein [Portunus trituberculatus]